MRLSDLKTGSTGIVTKVLGRNAFRRRILEMGFTAGRKVIVIKNAPLQDPIEYSLLDYNVSLRRNEASLIEIVTTDITFNKKIPYFEGVLDNEILKKTAGEKIKTINIAFVGNPNSGKTTIFNYASKSNQHVGNYSGVTVEAKTAEFKYKDYVIKITDLPGTYSLTAYSPEEIFVRDYIIKNIPDIVVNIVDSSNLERNLYLTSQLIDMDIKVIVALNMYDDLLKRKDTFDYKSLGKMIGIPFIPTIGSKGRGIIELIEKIIEVYNDGDPVVRHIHINYGSGIEESISKIQSLIKTKENFALTDRISSRFAAIKLIEKDPQIKVIIKSAKNYNAILEYTEKEVKKLEADYKEDSESIITNAKYGFINGALKETFKPGADRNHIKSGLIDNFLTNKYLGYPFFLLFIWFIFWATFNIGQYPMNLINKGVGILSSIVEGYMNNGPLKDLLVDGIIAGVGGVIVFLPNILILFFFISAMEDTGYMARAAFIMDKLMHKMGLHGKSFIPMIMGFGCNVPAILSTRTIENRDNRLLTILINPLMSCSARLPVYVLLIGTFFPKNQGSILFLVYLVGIFLAVGISILFKKVFFYKENSPFVMELPPYRLPTVRSLFKHMWYKGSQYLKKMGSVILIASIIIWGLGYFPKNIRYAYDYDKQISEIDKNYAVLIDKQKAKNVIKELEQQKEMKINALESEKNAEHLEKSYIGQIGKTIEPVIKPLGFDWKIGICLLTGVAAKEIVVSTMAVIYNTTDQKGKGTNSLSDKLIQSTYSSGKKQGEKVFSSLVAFSLLLFVLIYFPCIAVIAAIKKETGTWKWPVFTILYTTVLAWMVSFVVYQAGHLILSL